MTAVHVVLATAQNWPELGRVFAPGVRTPPRAGVSGFVATKSPTTAARSTVKFRMPRCPWACWPTARVTWSAGTRVVPRSTLPGVTENRALACILDADPDAWWMSCFAVRREHRASGVGTALLQAAMDWAAPHGASVLDGHPVDNRGLAGSASPSATFTGTSPCSSRPGSPRSAEPTEADPS